MIGHKRVWAVIFLAGALWAGPSTFSEAGDIGGVGHVSEPIPGRYIVVLDKTVPNVAIEASILKAQYGGTIRYVYQHALKGFAVDMPEADAIRLGRDPRVEYVEQSVRLYLPRVEDVAEDSPASRPAVGVPEVPWGLDRIDQRNLPLNGVYHSLVTGNGVKGYVIDSGIRSTHVDFGGRVIEGFSYYTNETEDCHGHGTHVAGILGGSKWGAAKRVTLVPVKITEDSGSECEYHTSLDAVIGGVDWVTGDYIAGQPAVANMSLAFRNGSASLDDAVGRSIADGIVYAVAAGNEGADACEFPGHPGTSPARVPAALTVAWSNIIGSQDEKDEFSNWGLCIDLFAPGGNITSAWHTSDVATDLQSGTSMASPHVAGAAALYLQIYPAASPSDVSKGLIKISTKGKIYMDYGSGVTPNRLLYRPAG